MSPNNRPPIRRGITALAQTNAKSVNTISFEISGDFTDPVSVWQKFLEAVNKVSGVTVMNSVTHTFPRQGLTGLVLLGESHAAIHTFPEHNYAWVELATCGDLQGLVDFTDLMIAAYGLK